MKPSQRIAEIFSQEYEKRDRVGGHRGLTPEAFASLKIDAIIAYLDEQHDLTVVAVEGIETGVKP